MNIPAFVDSLINGEWQSQDSREAIIAEVEVLYAELRDSSTVKEIVRNITEAVLSEHDL